MEQNAARMAEISAAAAAARAAEEAECRRILEDRTAAAGARRQQGRAIRHASRRAVPIISSMDSAERAICSRQFGQ